MAFAKIDGIVALALFVDCDERGAVVAVKLVMGGKVLRGLATEQPPFGSLYAGAFRHAIIVANATGAASVR
jgi:hypothetical protein